MPRTQNTPLLPGQVELLACNPATIDLNAHQPRYLGLLSSDELKRWDAIGAKQVRETFLIARALLRTGLSRYAQISPEDWQFVIGDHGKPEIHAGQNPSLCPLRFNLSHTQDLIVCGITVGSSLGVDVEYTPRHSRLESIAQRFFSAPEIAQLEGASKDTMRTDFFRFWTLKEAYLKARGTGITLPLGKFGFDLTNPSGPDIWFDPSLQDTPLAWCFTEQTIGHNHQLALALHRPCTETALQQKQEQIQFMTP